MGAKNKEQAKSSDSHLGKIINLWIGNSLGRLFTTCLFLGATCLGGAVASYKVDDAANALADWLKSKNWIGEQAAEAIRKGSVVAVDWLETNSAEAGYFAFFCALVLLFWILYERHLQHLQGGGAPQFSLKDGQVFFYGQKVATANWLTRLRVWLLKNPKNYIDDLKLRITPTEAEELRWYQPLNCRLPAHKNTKGKEKPTRMYPHKYLLKQINLKQSPSNSFAGKIFYLLGNSGVGKSTTLRKLYIALLFSKEGRHYHVFHLRFSEWEEKEKEWGHLTKRKIVLLLDAADEDVRFYDQNTLKEQQEKLAKANFYRVIISCRSQFLAEGAAASNLEILGFPDGVFNQYIKKRFSRWPWKNRKQKKTIRAVLKQLPDFSNRPMVVDWVCTLADQIDTRQFSAADIEYPYQVVERIITYWYDREHKRLEEFGFSITLPQLQTFMESLAIYFCQKAGAKQHIRSKELHEIFIRVVGGELSEEKLESVFAQGKTRGLLARNADGYFEFSHLALWEVILARLLFDNYHPAMGYDAGIEKISDVAHYYSQMCWAEIVPADFFKWKAARKMQYQWHKERDILSLLKEKDAFYLNEQEAQQTAKKIGAFREPAARAFFLGMDKAALQELPKQADQFACFAYMLQNWRQQNQLPSQQEEQLLTAFAQRFRAAWVLDKATRYFQEALDEKTDLTSSDYLKRPQALFVLRNDRQIWPKHKCVLDYYLLEAQVLESLDFISTYPRCSSFVLEEMATRMGQNLWSSELRIAKPSGIALLYFHPQPDSVKKLQASGLNLTDLPWISRFAKLEELDLSNNQLSDVSALAGLKSLHTLDLGNNQLASIAGLLGRLETEPDEYGRRRSGLQLPQLQLLRLADNPALQLAEETKKILAWQPNLGYLTLDGDWPTDNETGVLRALRDEILQEPTMVEVAEGHFTMGRTDNYQIPRSYNEKGRDNVNTWLSWELPTRTVRIAGFQMGKFPVTLAEFRRFIAATQYQTTAERQGGSTIPNYEAQRWEQKPGTCWQHDHRGEPAIQELWPVLHVSWYDAVAYCNWLSKTQGLRPCYEIEEETTEEGEAPSTRVTLLHSSGGYRLPTEAEWEYAAKGGNRQQPFMYAGSNDLAQLAWHGANAGGVAIEESVEEPGYSWGKISFAAPHPHPVGQLLSNGLGIYDMSGNVAEWCEDDWYDNYQNAPLTGTARIDNPRGSFRVLRGGFWYADAFDCRTAGRDHDAPAGRYAFIGFRLVLVRPSVIG